MTPTQNQQTPKQDQKKTPVREFPELDPSEPQKPEQNPPPIMDQENPRKNSASTNTNVNSQPDREKNNRSGNQQKDSNTNNQQ